MDKKLNLKQIFWCIDRNCKEAWKVFTEEEIKGISFWTLNRFVSSVNLPAKQAEAVLRTNEVYNKNYLAISTNKDTGHPQLMWQLLCTASVVQQDVEKKKVFHKFISPKKANNSDNKKIKILEKIYPNMKNDEVTLLAKLSTDDEVSRLADEHRLDT